MVKKSKLASIADKEQEGNLVEILHGKAMNNSNQNLKLMKTILMLE